MDNEKYLALFQSYLENYGVSSHVIEKYMNEVDAYLNDFLKDIRNRPMHHGTRDVDVYYKNYFKGDLDFSIKCIKLFYRCMKDYGYIEKEVYDFLEWLISQNKKDWI